MNAEAREGGRERGEGGRKERREGGREERAKGYGSGFLSLT